MRVRIEVGPPKEKLGVPEARDWMMGSPTHTHIHACFLTPPTLPKPFAGAKLLIIITVAQRLTAGSERNPDSVSPPSGGPLAHPAQGEILQFPCKAGGQSPEGDEIPEEKDRDPATDLRARPLSSVARASSPRWALGPATGRVRVRMG